MRFLLLFLALMISAVSDVIAQDEDCALNEQLVLEAVENICANVGANEVCYGNFQVNAIARDPALILQFSNPGDSTSLANLRSLYLSSLNPTTSTWGIAQMRLLLTAPEGLQDVSMLLFGDVSIENAANTGSVFDVTVRTVAGEILNTPDSGGLVLETVDQGTLLSAVGRTQDTLWLRVQNPLTNNIGWIATELVRAVDLASDFALLAVQQSGTQYYGPMQAFYFSNGSSGNCANVASDGLLIQTPEGMARVSLLINEVSIELNASTEGDGATAFIQANPQEETGMSINVLTGQANVQTPDGGQQVVESGMQTTIPLQMDLSPRGSPSAPVTFNPQDIRVESFLPVLRAPSTQRPLVDSSGNLNLSLPTGTGSQSGGTGGSGSVAIGDSSGGSSGSGSSAGTTGSGSGSSTSGSVSGGSTSGSGDAGSLTGALIGAATTGGTQTNQDFESTPTEGLSIFNVVAVVFLVLLGFGLLYWLLRYTGRSTPTEAE